MLLQSVRNAFSFAATFSSNLDLLPSKPWVSVTQYRSEVSKAASTFYFQSCCQLMFPNLFCAAVALLVVSSLFLSQLSVLYSAKTPVGRCLRGVFPAPAWIAAASASAGFWISPPLLLLPLVCLWVVAPCPARPGDASPDTERLWAVRRPTEWHRLLSCVPAPQFPPQLPTGAGEMRTSLDSQPVPPRHLQFFSKQTVLDNRHHRERVMIQTSDSQHCFCLV